MNPAFVTSGATALTSGLKRSSGQSLTPIKTTSQPTLALWQMSASRKFLVGGNWKCNLDKASIAALVNEFNAAPALDTSNVEVVVAPPSVYLDSTRAQLRGDFATSAQNAWIGKGGAFTGELDATMIRDCGADWVILGHSERRHHQVINESDETIATKAKYAIEEAGLKVIYCVGELLEERERGQTLEVVTRQLDALKDANVDWDKIVIAYEPVWAIGTGKVATPEQAEEVHLSIREWLRRGGWENVRVLYGGSVSPANCQELAKKENVDGFLVGGASLKASFLEIVDAYKVTLAGAV